MGADDRGPSFLVNAIEGHVVCVFREQRSVGDRVAGVPRGQQPADQVTNGLDTRVVRDGIRR